MPPPVSKKSQVLETCGSCFEHNLEIYARVAATWRLETKNPSRLTRGSSLGHFRRGNVLPNKESSRTPGKDHQPVRARSPLEPPKCQLDDLSETLVLPSSVPAQCLTLNQCAKEICKRIAVGRLAKFKAPPQFSITFKRNAVFKGTTLMV